MGFVGNAAHLIYLSFKSRKLRWVGHIVWRGNTIYAQDSDGEMFPETISKVVEVR
jgi:hypothetical protein